MAYVRSSKRSALWVNHPGVGRRIHRAVQIEAARLRRQGVDDERAILLAVGNVELSRDRAAEAAAGGRGRSR